MAETSLQTKIAYYKRVVEEGKKSKNSERYQKMCEALGTLMEMTGELRSTNREMTPDEFEGLKQAYKEVADRCEDYIGAEDISKYEMARKGIVEDIANIIARDSLALSNANPSKPGTLSDVMDKARSRTLVLTPDEVKTMGGALSKRIPVKTRGNKKGFFTRIEEYKPDEKFLETIGKYKESFALIAPGFEEVLSGYKENPEAIDALLEKCPTKAITPGENGNITTTDGKTVVAFAKSIGLGKEDNEIYKLFGEHETLLETLVKCINELAPQANQRGVMVQAGIQKGSSVSSRNCAMTDIAELLGCRDLLAESVPMTIKIGNEEVKGVFMETAEGSDINRLKESDDIFKADRASFDNPEALKQILDLQVLDFICGNIDRHAGNMIYQFEPAPGGRVTFKGIKGIDNDCSLGTTPEVYTGVGNINRMVRPENMEYITESMFNRLNNLTFDEFQLKLQHYDFTDAELEAMRDRFEMVKEMANSKELQVADDAFWKSEDLLASEREEGMNYIENIQWIKNCCHTEDYSQFDIDEGNGIQYVQDTISDKRVLLENADRVAALREQMNAARALIYNSDEYDLMENAFKKVEDLNNQIKAYPNAEAVPNELAEQAKAAYQNLADKTTFYIGLKKVVPFQTRGQRRMKLALDLQSFADELLTKMDVELKKESEKSTAEANKKADIGKPNQPERAKAETVKSNQQKDAFADMLFDNEEDVNFTGDNNFQGQAEQNNEASRQQSEASVGESNMPNPNPIPMPMPQFNGGREYQYEEDDGFVDDKEEEMGREF